MRNSRLWSGLSSVFSFLLIAAILGTGCMMQYEGTVNGALGIRTSKVVNEDDVDAKDLVYFESEYGELNAENLQKLIADTYAESVQEEEEGAVLLKNENGALPLAAEETRVTLFGHAVADPLYTAPSAGSRGFESEYCIDLYTALTNAGFEINDTLYQAYASSETKRGNGARDHQKQVDNEWLMGEEDISFYTDALRQSWENDYNDAAIVMFAREGGEGSELYMEDPAEGISQLALHRQEKDLLQMIKDSGKFEKVIVLVNSGWAMELGWLDEYDVDACLWIGAPGQRGFEGVANILTGKANPSGHLTDTYAVNSVSAPATVNSGYNNQNWTNLEEVLELSTEGDADVSWYTAQVEGIYIGYKYYETRYEDSVLGQGNANSSKGSSTGKAWNYADEVSYPFGFGLSYTSFEQTLDDVEINGDDITVTVTVTNVGDTAGKSAVQVYAQTPYGEYEKKNLVEKSAIGLLDFGKTKILEPGESETLTITCDKYLLASYDYKNAKGYILSEGDYYIAIGDDAHDALNNVLAAKGAQGMVDETGAPKSGNADKTYRWSEAFDKETYRTSRVTGEEVTNQFDEYDLNYWIDDCVTYLSRSNWDATYPLEAVQVAATEAMVEALDGDMYEKPEDAPSVSSFTQGDRKGIPLAAMIGLDYDDPKWEEYLDQFTIEEMANLLPDSYNNNPLPEMGVPSVIPGDGPDGVGGTFSKELYGDGRNDCCFPCEVILASTFNKDLMRRRGELMGEEAMYLGMTHVWMLGANLHRTPFGGRNFEYYSEDATMSYLCQIPESEGIASKGVHAGMKHLVGNDQENNRMGVAHYFNEQAFRESALRGFEGAITKGDSKAVMHGFNRIGMKWCSASEELCTDVLVNEWGFEGIQETDAIYLGLPYHCHYETTLAVGTDFYCFDIAEGASYVIPKAIKENDDGNLLRILREATRDHLYIVANSSIMNGYSENSKVVSVTPWWKIVMGVLIAAFALFDVTCIVLLARSKRKDKVKVEEVQKS